MHPSMSRTLVIAARTISAGVIVVSLAQPPLAAIAAGPRPTQAAPAFTPRVAPTTTFELDARTTSRLTTLRPDNIPTRCVLTGSQANVCRVILTTRVHGMRSTIGFGVTRFDGSRARMIKVPVYLNRHGLTLASRPHGVMTTVHGEVRALSTNSWLRAIDKTRIRSTFG
jgi:hypothetical protein